MDGLELTRLPKRDPVRRHITIVALTAYAMKSDEEKARAAGCDGYVTKPIDTRALPKLIAGLLESGLRSLSAAAVGKRRADQTEVTSAQPLRPAIFGLLKAVSIAQTSKSNWFHELIESAEDPITAVSASSGRLVSVNAAFGRKVGFDRQDLLGKTPFEIGFLEDRPSYDQFFAAAACGRRK
jgi:CheY-like chemotaxis protein